MIEIFVSKANSLIHDRDVVIDFGLGEKLELQLSNSSFEQFVLFVKKIDQIQADGCKVEFFILEEV